MRLPITALDAPPVRWHSIGSLPCDLRRELDDPGALEPASGPMGSLWRVSPLRFALVGVILGALALDRVLERPPTAAFHSPARLTLSIAAVASLAAAVA